MNKNQNKKKHRTRDELKRALKAHSGKKGFSFDDIIAEKEKATSSDAASQNNDNENQL